MRRDRSVSEPLTGLFVGVDSFPVHVSTLALNRRVHLVHVRVVHNPKNLFFVDGESD
jgi:hypothetical protein